MNHRITAQLTALAAVALLTFGASQAFARRNRFRNGNLQHCAN